MRSRARALHDHLTVENDVVRRQIGQGASPEWIRRMHAQFKERLLVDGQLPKPILERLAALEEAERRRSGERADERGSKPRIGGLAGG